MTKDAEQNGGYRLGLENCVLSETADHCFFRCQPPRVPPAPSRPVWPDVLSCDFLLRVKSVSSPSAYTQKRVLENQKIEIKEATNGNPGCRGLHSGAVEGKCGGAVDEAQQAGSHAPKRKVGGRPCVSAALGNCIASRVGSQTGHSRAGQGGWEHC